MDESYSGVLWWVRGFGREARRVATGALAASALAGCAPQIDVPAEVVDGRARNPGDDACFAARGLPDRAIDDDLSPPTLTTAETVGGLGYIEARGLFEGTTDFGAFRVPYIVSVPTSDHSGVLSDVILFELPHFFSNIAGRNEFFGKDFLFGRGGAHAAAGWALGTENELDHACFDDGRCFIEAEWDPQILTEFAVALLVDPDVQDVVGGRTCRYATGFSQSSGPFALVIPGGYADEVLDLAIPFTTSGESLYDIGWQQAVADGVFTGKLVIVNSEFEEQEWLAEGVHDDGTARFGYRYYAVPGTAHIPDIIEMPDPLWSNTSPADYRQDVRGRFLQAHRWVTEGKTPEPSTLLLRDANGDVAVDERGNAIVVDVSGQRVARQPYVSLGEATFLYKPADGFPLVGDVQDVRTVQELGFANHPAYLGAFRRDAQDWARAAGVAADDVEALIRRAACAPYTYTQLYEEDYDAFVAGGCAPGD